MHDIAQIDDKFIHGNTIFSELIAKLKEGFASGNILVPMRHHHDFPNPKVGQDSTLLVMPAWNTGREAGVKIVTVSPENGQFGLPSIQGVYILIDSEKGGIKAIVQAKSLTVKRTAAASALASSYLSKKNASSMLMVGTGALSTNLIKAHASVRPIETVYVWGRNFEKAAQICLALKDEKFRVKAVASITDIISEVDIISTATLSKDPLILGKWLRPGQHIDLVGAYKKDMREADDETILRASVYVDTFQGGLKESGDIVIPLNNGLLKKDAIKSDLFGLCADRDKGRTDASEITVFKSVGHALEDLVGATYYYNKYMNG